MTVVEADGDSGGDGYGGAIVAASVDVAEQWRQ